MIRIPSGAIRVTGEWKTFALFLGKDFPSGSGGPGPGAVEFGALDRRGCVPRLSLAFWLASGEVLAGSAVSSLRSRHSLILRMEWEGKYWKVLFGHL